MRLESERASYVRYKQLRIIFDSFNREIVKYPGGLAVGSSQAGYADFTFSQTVAVFTGLPVLPQIMWQGGLYANPAFELSLLCRIQHK
jgi:hypothetical protein